MRSAGLICLSIWLLAASASGQTNRSWAIYRNPVRVFGAHSVDLRPLYEWWKSQSVPINAAAYTNAVIDVDTNSADPGNARPLPAWHFVTGTYIGTMEGGSWVVNALIYTSPSARTNARIILNHPPTVEQQTYDALKQQVAQATELIATAERAFHADEKAQRAQVYRHSNTKVALDGYRAYSRLATQYKDAAAADLRKQHELEAARDKAAKALKTIPAVNGMYHIDWFALMLGRSKQGLPIYDMGLARPGSP